VVVVTTAGWLVALTVTVLVITPVAEGDRRTANVTVREAPGAMSPRGAASDAAPESVRRAAWSVTLVVGPSVEPLASAWAAIRSPRAFSCSGVRLASMSAAFISAAS
jgi:hypothetical protein